MDDDKNREKDKEKAIELGKRKAAGRAASTRGRRRVFEDRTKYNRNKDKIDDS